MYEQARPRACKHAFITQQWGQEGGDVTALLHTSSRL